MNNEIVKFLELFTFDLTSFFIEEDYEEISCIEESGMFMIEYQKTLPWTELGLFNNLVFRVFNDKQNIIGSSHINAQLQAEDDLITLEKVKTLIDSLYDVYKRDDENQGQWNTSDESNFNTKLIERFWTRGEGNKIYTIKLTFSKSTGLVVKILFFNHFLTLNKK